MKKAFVLAAIALCLNLPAFGAADGAAVTQGGQEAEAPRADENNPDFYLELIGKMQQRRLFFASLAHLDAFEQRWPNDRRAWLMRADALRQIGDFEAARRAYRRILAVEPSARALHGLGLIAAAENKLPEAVETLRQASRLAPIDVRILNDLGYVELLLGQLSAARMSLNKAAELEPDNRQVGANLALYFWLEGNLERAEKTLERYAFPEAQRASIRRDAQTLREKIASPARNESESDSGKNVK